MHPQLTLDPQLESAIRKLCDVALRVGGMDALPDVVLVQTRLQEAKALAAECERPDELG